MMGFGIARSLDTADGGASEDRYKMVVMRFEGGAVVRAGFESVRFRAGR